MARRQSEDLEPQEPTEEDPVALGVATLERPARAKTKKELKIKAPWRGGWVIKHHWFGSMRIWDSTKLLGIDPDRKARTPCAANEAEAVELFRQTRCPAHDLNDIRRNLRVVRVEFVPAATERDKKLDARPDWEKKA